MPNLLVPRPFETKSFKFKIDTANVVERKDEATGARIGEFEGYCSVFGNVDSWGDVVMKGAFTRTLKAWADAGKMVKMLYQHDWMSPIGRWPSLEQDNHGLYGKGQINLELQLGRDTMSNIKMGIIDGISIGYESIGAYMDKGIRMLPEVKLYENSPVVYPANDLAEITAVKGYLRKTATEVQSLMLSTEKFRTHEEAKAWADEHGFKTEKSETGDKFHRFMQFDSEECQEGCDNSVDLAEGVKAIVGKRKKSAIVTRLTALVDDFYEKTEEGPADGHPCSCSTRTKAHEAPVHDHAFDNALKELAETFRGR